MPGTIPSRAARRGGTRLAVLVCAVAVSAIGTAEAENWCDVVFKDVLDEAASVVIARYHGTGSSSPAFTVQEVLKGTCTDEQLDLDLEELDPYRLKEGDQLVVALTSYHQPVRLVRGMGGCTAVSVLPIRGGKLRSKDRADYDFSGKSMTLEALRAELLELLGAD